MLLYGAAFDPWSASFVMVMKKLFALAPVPCAAEIARQNVKLLPPQTSFDEPNAYWAFDGASGAAINAAAPMIDQPLKRIVVTREKGTSTWTGLVRPKNARSGGKSCSYILTQF